VVWAFSWSVCVWGGAPGCLRGRVPARLPARRKTLPCPQRSSCSSGACLGNFNVTSTFAFFSKALRQRANLISLYLIVSENIVGKALRVEKARIAVDLQKSSSFV
jgi:hypothetical protein